MKNGSCCQRYWGKPDYAFLISWQLFGGSKCTNNDFWDLGICVVYFWPRRWVFFLLSCHSCTLDVTWGATCKKDAKVSNPVSVLSKYDNPIMGQIFQLCPISICSQMNLEICAMSILGKVAILLPLTAVKFNIWCLMLRFLLFPAFVLPWAIAVLHSKLLLNLGGERIRVMSKINSGIWVYTEWCLLLCASLKHCKERDCQYNYIKSLSGWI